MVEGNAPSKFLLKELKAMGFSYSASVRLLETYGEDAVSIVRDEPYRMAIEVPGINFKTADAVAAGLEKSRAARRDGVDTNQNGFLADHLGDAAAGQGNNADIRSDERTSSRSAQRTAAGILYILTRYAAEGHTCIPRNKLRDRAVELLDVTGDEIEDALFTLTIEGRVTEAALDGVPFVFLSAYLLAERHVCSDLMRLMTSEPSRLYADADDLIRTTEASLGIELSAEQRDAVKQSLGCGVFVITGGPGTGKTTIIRAVIDIFEHARLKTAVAAPTGRAAKRVTEATGHKASTIHRLLEYYYDEAAREMYFGRNADNRLDHDAVIIDEASMVDALLMEALLAAMKTGARLIIVGDVDQLPPVGAGDILRDILGSGRIGSAVLTEIYRRAAESMITVNAHRINRGEYPATPSGETDFFMIECGTGIAALQSILELCEGRLPAALPHSIPGTGIAALASIPERCGGRLPAALPRSIPEAGIQVLTPMKKGMLGNANLNKELQAALNPPGPGRAERKYGERIFRLGDRVMQTRNNYSLEWTDSSDGAEGRGIFNGDMGVIVDIDAASGAVTVAYDDTKHVSYGSEGLLEIEHAYAITVHKSQGSEFPAVIIPVYAAAPMLMTRNLIYTAVTRGKKLVVLIGSMDRMRQMIDNDRSLARYSGLKSFLMEYASAL
ncbi:MAG: AAA family ATPase [Clostridiales Family XIII bacterium]|jgi:exodeoxyribonuclease V alpha subunit|nr:AAA family ATPase [Clostridiales Family XIII bacterium]